MGEAIEAIETNSDFTFLYSDDQIPPARNLTIRCKQADIRTILDECLKHTNLSYRLVDKTIILIPKPLSGIPAGTPPPLPAEHFFDLPGQVKDQQGIPLQGVSIYIKNLPGIGIASGPQGMFTAKVRISDILVFSCVGYKSKEILISRKPETLPVVLEAATEQIDEVQIVGYGTQRKISVTGAISTFQTAGRNFPITSFSNAIAGNVAGLIGVQRNGEPGRDASEFWIRGISTFGANDKALILIDGIERTTLNDLIPEDIESFSVLKDATATAVYGARGANGVILITTQRGTAGKMKICANVRSMFSHLPRLPEYLRAYDYASLSNEARIIRGETPVYPAEIFPVIRHGLDPDLYPDVNWQHELLKKWTQSYQANINISGGGDIGRYYMSLNYKSNDAAYRESGLNRYHTNVTRKQYSFRTNLDFTLTKSTVVSINLATTLADLNRPGIGLTDTIWAAQAKLSPLTVPIRYSTGELPSYGKDNLASPVTLLNETGFVSDYQHNLESKLEIRQDLSRLFSGLSASAALAYDITNQHSSSRTKTPALYRASGRNPSGNLILERQVPEKAMQYHTASASDRRLYLEAKLDYNRSSGAHRQGALLLYSQSQYNTTEAGNEIESIPRRTQGIAGRITYSYQDIYFSEFNFGYNGTENFPKGQRFGFFPSLSAGWIVSNYDVFRKNLPFIQKLKVRYSYGIVGNDQILNSRFPYLTYISSGVPGYAFGNHGENEYSGISETVIGTDHLSWERAFKHNAGIEISIAGKLNIEADYFSEHRKGIFMQRENLPDIAGIPSKPFGNVGSMSNKGFDATVAYLEQIGGLKFEIRGNITFTRNKILEYDEPRLQYAYQERKGKSLDVTRGYIALGYFRDSADILNSPVHMDRVYPGDLKYKDINGDGIINQQDIVPIGNSSIPKIQYGFAGNLNWKNWQLGLFFRGACAVDFFYGGSGYFPFSEGETGNVLAMAGQAENRWIPAWYSGRQATENQSARFPRLSYGPNKNNFEPSTHWLANGAYLRLKTVEIGYSFPAPMLQKIGIKELRISLMGDNLHIWDSVKNWDPEQASSNGAVYPLSRSFLFNLQLAI